MNIDIDVDGIDAAQLMLGKQPNAIKRAMSSSINRALTAGRTALSKGIRSEYNIKAGTIKVLQNQKRLLLPVARALLL